MCTDQWQASRSEGQSRKEKVPSVLQPVELDSTNNWNAIGGRLISRVSRNSQANNTLTSDMWDPNQKYSHSRPDSWPIESESHSVVSDSLPPHGLYSPWNSLGQYTGVGSLALLQGIFPTQGLNPGLLLCRWILYQLSHRKACQNILDIWKNIKRLLHFIS